jgi:hypothetical protein
MRRFTLAALIAAGLLWSAGTAPAQYRSRASHGNTMSGHTGTMTGHLSTNHSHLMPRPVGVTSYSPSYSPGGFGPTVYPGGNYYNPSMWSGPAYSVYPAGGYGGYGLYGRRW